MGTTRFRVLAKRLVEHSSELQDDEGLTRPRPGHNPVMRQVGNDCWFDDDDPINWMDLDLYLWGLEVEARMVPEVRPDGPA